MTYREQQRLADIQAAIDAIRSHLYRGDLSDGLISDAVRIRLLEIGEAVKALPAEMLGSQPDIAWTQIARMRDHLAHRYFDTDHAILQATVDNDLPELERAVQKLAATLPAEGRQEEDPPSSLQRKSGAVHGGQQNDARRAARPCLRGLHELERWQTLLHPAGPGARAGGVRERAGRDGIPGCRRARRRQRTRARAFRSR